MTSLKAVVGTVMAVSLTGASALLLYLMFKKREDNSSRRRLQRQGEAFNHVTVDIHIPNQVVGVVIGRQGCNINNIQDKTRTRIRFKDEVGRENSRVCQITGSEESVAYAQNLIHDLIRNQPLITTSEMLVPSKAVGRIIGRCGENIHQITVSSGAKVSIDGTSSKGKAQFAPHRVVLKGTADQIQVARSMIEGKIAEENELRKRYEAGAASRSPRKNKAPGYLTAGEASQGAVDTPPPAERLDPMSSDESLEVYLSAVETPSQFWVQILSPSATELDQLVVKMTEHYSKPENQDFHKLTEVSPGQMVAAPFVDEKWYRAQVLNLTVDDYEPANSSVELFYVDYGDTSDVQQSKVYELRTDFLMLRPQAIECCLAKVKPIDDTWSDEAVDLFEELTFSAQWKVILCKVDHYDSSIRRKQDRGKREGSPVPVVELFNISGPKDINVGDELVKNQFAVYTDPMPASEKPGKPEGKVKTSTDQSGPGKQEESIPGPSGDRNPAGSRAGKQSSAGGVNGHTQ